MESALIKGVLDSALKAALAAVETNPSLKFGSTFASKLAGTQLDLSKEELAALEQAPPDAWQQALEQIDIAAYNSAQTAAGLQRVEDMLNEVRSALRDSGEGRHRDLEKLASAIDYVAEPIEAQSRGKNSTQNTSEIVSAVSAGQKSTVGVRLLRTMDSSHGAIGRMEWSPDGKKIATPHQDGTVVVWDVETGGQLVTLDGHEDRVICVSWSPDGQFIASGSDDQTLRIWEVATGSSKQIVEWPSGPVSAVSWSPIKDVVAMVDRAGAGMLVPTDRNVNRLFLKGAEGQGSSLLWFQNGDRLLASMEGGTSLHSWEMEGSSHRGSTTTSRVYDLTWVAPNETFACASGDRSVGLYDARTLSRTASLEGHDEEVVSVSRSFNGLLLASKSMDGEVRLWNMEKRTVVGVLSDPRSQYFMTGVAFHPKEYKLATLGGDNNGVRIWDIDLSTLLSQSARPSADTRSSDTHQSRKTLNWSNSVADAFLSGAVLAGSSRIQMDPTILLLAALVQIGHAHGRQNTSGLLAELLASHGPNPNGDADFVVDHLRLPPEYELDLQQVPFRGSGDKSNFSQELKSVLDRATRIAEYVTSSTKIHTRHLIAALLAPAPSGSVPAVQEHLSRNGYEIQRLRESLLDGFGSYELPNDDVGKWQEVILHGNLGKRESTSLLNRGKRIGFNPDIHTGMKVPVDRLGLDEEVSALCSLIAAYDVPPPLAIGLFGDWGSGKTFFMDLMIERLRVIAKESAAAEEREEQSLFHSRIVQIKFNAWHYVDADLWACLVTHILESLIEDLTKDDKTKLEQTREHLFQELDSAKEQLQAAKREIEFLERKKKQAGETAESLKAEIRKAEQQLEGIGVRDVIAEALADPTVKGDLSEVASDLGITQGGAELAYEETRKTVSEIRGLVGRCKRFWRELADGTNGKAKRLGFIVIFAGAPVVAGFIVSGLSRFVSDSELVRRVLGQVMFGAGLVLQYMRRVRPRLRELNAAVAAFENADKRLDVIVSQKKNVRQKEAQRKVESIIEKQRQVKKRQDDATQRIEALNDEIKEISAGRRLYQFLQESSARAKYRKSLGIITQIRRDLKKLCELIDAARSDEEETGLPRVDRIVLYIDDLDRCPSERVVEVLQAVHLLLAWELFIVVVGVDSRWLLNSLQEEYSAFSVPPGSEESRANLPQQWHITPQNYIEKIFHIPFWLRDMDSEGFKRLVDSLIRETPVRITGGGVEEASIDVLPSATVRKSEVTEDAIERGPESPDRIDGVTTLPKPTTPPHSRDGDVSSESAEADQGPTEKRDGKMNPPGDDAQENLQDYSEEIDLNPENLSLQPWEREFVGRLGTLVPSPRAAKRLVNIYRLIKVTIRDLSDLQLFEGTADVAGDCQAVLIMLGIQASFSKEANSILRYLNKQPANQEWWSFVNSLRPIRQEPGAPKVYKNAVCPEIQDGDFEAWSRLCDTLEGLKERGFTMSNSLIPFMRRSRIVSRFSFRPV